MYDIIVNGLKIFAFHGVNQSEKENGQEFIIDVVVKADIDLENLEDNIKNTVNYSYIVKIINEQMKIKKYDLIESAAYNVQKAIFDRFEAVKEIDLTLKKPQAPIKAEFNFVAVHIKSNRSDFNG